MRHFIISGMLAGGALLATLASGTGSAAQAQTARFCAHYDWSTVNCGFYTREQCLATISGVGGYCTQQLNGPRVYGSTHGSDTPGKKRKRLTD